MRAPKGTGTRPTAQRARQAIFEILGDLQDFRVLDWYAGSGSLGIEALSRGAAHAVFVEASRPAIAILRSNLARIKALSYATVLDVRVERSLRLLEHYRPFDLVLCDPPWPELARALDFIAAVGWAGLLANEARLVIEHPARLRLIMGPDSGLLAIDRRHWGSTGMTLFRRLPEPTPCGP